MNIPSQLQTKYEEMEIINYSLIELRKRQLELNREIIQLLNSIKELPPIMIHPTNDKTNDIISGSRCITCGRISELQCFTCKNQDKPSGYCFSHKGDHGYNNKHTPIYLMVKQFTIKPDNILSPQQELERLQQLQKELSKQIEQKKKEII